MGKEVCERQSAPRGRVRGCRFNPVNFPGGDFFPPAVIHEIEPVTKFKHNLILREWGAIVGKLLLREGPQFGIGGMYIEFANSASPVSVPSYDRGPDSGVEYYNSLSGDSTKDYLRVQLISGVLGVSDQTTFPKGNQPTFFAMTSGTTGVHGKAYSDVANSRVIGAALVAMPDEADATQDLVFSRFYFDTDEQIPKLATGQIGVEWEVTLG